MGTEDIFTRWLVADSQKAHTLADLHGHPPIRVDPRSALLYDKLGSISITGKIEYMAMGVHASFQRSANECTLWCVQVTAQHGPTPG